MAPVKSEFTLLHSVFIPFEYSTGQRPEPFENRVEDVVQTADTLLDKRGYFTSAFDDPSSETQFYMIGFKRPSESGVQRQSERLFDLYFANADDLEGKDLRAIVGRLREFPGKACVPTENVVKEITVEVRESPGARGSNDRRQSGAKAESDNDTDAEPRDDPGEQRNDSGRQSSGRDGPGKDIWEDTIGENSRAPNGDSRPTGEDARTPDDGWSPPRSQSPDRIVVPSVDETTTEFNVGTVAELWEQYRQSDLEPIRATLRELSYFTATVEGSLPEFKVVEEGNGDVRHFNVVVGERSRRKQYPALKQLLQHRPPASWEDLPSYRDELEAYRSHYKSELRQEASYSSEIDELLDDLGRELDEIVETHVEHAVELYSNQFEPGQSIDDGGFDLKGVTGMLSGSEDDVVRRIKNETATSRVSEEEKKYIVEKMMEDVRDDVWNEVESTVRSMLMPELESAVDRHAESMARNVVSKVDQVRGLKSYDEA